MNKEEIIRLAKEKKFISNVLYNNPYKYSNNEDKRWLFWLTELQTWLRDDFNVDVIVTRHDNEFINFVKERNDWKLEKYYNYINVGGESLTEGRYQNNEHVKCLEYGIIYVLKNIV